MKKKIIIVLFSILFFLLLILFFKNEFYSIIWEKKYEYKYKDAKLVEKSLSFDKSENILETNSIDINDFKIILSNLNYNSTENKLDFYLKFKNKNNLNHIGYILRVYNDDYCLGDRFNGYVSIASTIEYTINYNKFYEENFGYRKKNIDLTKYISIENDLYNECKMSKQDEQLEDGSFIHKISFELPERFVINNNLKIELVDLNYQNVGDKVFYHVQEPMTEIRYNINFSTTMPQTSND